MMRYKTDGLGMMEGALLAAAMILIAGWLL